MATWRKTENLGKGLAPKLPQELLELQRQVFHDRLTTAPVINLGFSSCEHLQDSGSFERGLLLWMLTWALRIVCIVNLYKAPKSCYLMLLFC